MHYMKIGIIIFLLNIFFAIVGFQFTSDSYKQVGNDKQFYATVQKHRQIYSMSCIPSSVEMVLKYNKKVSPDYFQLQEVWKDKADGSFQNFDGKTIKGLTFTCRFREPRNRNFPINSLYKVIEDELKAGRKIIISLPSGPDFWHIYVLDHKTEDGEFVAYSRGYNDNNVLEIRKVKELIKAINGTDILTYKLSDVDKE